MSDRPGEAAPPLPGTDEEELEAAHAPFDEDDEPVCAWSAFVVARQGMLRALDAALEGDLPPEHWLMLPIEFEATHNAMRGLIALREASRAG